MKMLIVAMALVGWCLWPSAALAQHAPNPSTVAVVPVPVVPSSPATGSPATNPGSTSDSKPSVVIVNSGPSMDEIKQQTPGLFLSALGGLLSALAQGLDDVLKVATGFNFLTQTPPGLSYSHPDVVRLWGSLRAVADAALALVAMVGGYNLMARRALAARSDGALEFLPRLLVGALLVNTSLWWASLAIDLNNALCQSIGAAGFPGWGRIAGNIALDAGVATPWAPGRLLFVLSLLLYLVLCLLLAVQMLMRLVLVDVLLVVAPLGLLCWILPQTERWARLWSTTFVGAVFTQFLQVAAMLLSGNLLTAVGSGSGIAGTALGPLLGLATVVLVLKLPGIVGHQLADGWGTLRGVLVGQATRGIAPSIGRGVGGASGSSSASIAPRGRP